MCRFHSNTLSYGGLAHLAFGYLRGSWNHVLWILIESSSARRSLDPVLGGAGTSSESQVPKQRVVSPFGQGPEQQYGAHHPVWLKSKDVDVYYKGRALGLSPQLWFSQMR